MLCSTTVCIVSASSMTLALARDLLDDPAAGGEASLEEPDLTSLTAGGLGAALFLFLLGGVELRDDDPDLDVGTMSTK